MRDFLDFKRMITPSIIRIVFLFGAMIFIFGGIAVIIRQYWDNDNDVNKYMVLAGTCSIIIAPILWRIFCECFMLFFRINETLTEINNNIRQSTLLEHKS